MTEFDPKAHLHRYLRLARDTMVWKLDGLSEYDARRPLTPTGTNLLGLVKHLAGVEAGYFGDTFGRPFPEPMPWAEVEGVPNIDMWATADESRDHIVGLYRRVCTHSDATIDELDIAAPGSVPWWGARGEVTLHQILVHVVAETNRHAGHADIVREHIDGVAGLRADVSNLPEHDEAWWAAYRAQIEQAALSA